MPFFQKKPVIIEARQLTNDNIDEAKTDEKVEHSQAFHTTNKLDEAFERWWFDEGSEMPPLPDEDHGFHARRIARIAWHNGAFVKQQLENN